MNSPGVQLLLLHLEPEFRMQVAFSQPVVVLSILGLIILVLDVCFSFMVVARLKPTEKPATFVQPVYNIQSIKNAPNPKNGAIKPSLNNAPASTLSRVDNTPGHSTEKSGSGFDPTILDNVNHEIRTPLAGIMAAAQVLHDELGPHHREFTTMLVENSRRMSRAISNVIDLVMLEKDEYRVDHTELNLSKELNTLIASHEKSAREKGIHLEVPAIEQHLTLQTDAQLLRKVLSHLLSNAIKFTDEGAVSLNVKLDQRWVHVEIKDSGPGIPNTLLPALYKPFVQGSQGLTRSHNGQGLGLALTRRMIDLAGGKIHVMTRPGNGSTFTVSYPKIPNPQI